MCLVAAISAAQSLYRYRDEHGDWVYTDRRPDAVRDVEEQLLTTPTASSDIKVLRRVVDDRVELVADNGCFCPAEVAVWLLEPANVAGFDQQTARVVLPAREPTLIARLKPADPSRAMSFGYGYRVLLGEPGVQHAPPEPYRAPFAVARQFMVTQAYPDQVTHTDAASRFAVDIAMPVGTQVYAARGGTVIEVASQFFEATVDPERAMRANLIRVLHPDGTMSIYAHLNWDSIRVKPGQIIKRGEYIADSGNTGFSSGPHLHFAVQRNGGLMQESLPIAFAGPGGKPVTPRSGTLLVAY